MIEELYKNENVTTYSHCSETTENRAAFEA